jgi:transcriptional regulator with XRE-family HTH domain
MPTKQQLGERIKRFRLERNLTLKDVEVKAKVSATHVSEIERGMTSPTVGALTKIARALGTEPSYFLQNDPVPGFRGTVRHCAWI